jgi:hypothetical protein
MYRKIAALLLVMTCTIIGFSQKKDKLILPAKTTLLRFNATTIIDPIETNLSLGVEHKFTNIWSAGLDVGYVFQSSYFEASNKASGIILRPAIRLYSGTFKRGYIEAELQYKRVVSKIIDWLGRSCVNGVPAYSEYTSFKAVKSTYGLNLKYGYQGKLSKKGKTWIEPYIGLGIRLKSNEILNEQNSCYRLNRLFRGITNDQDNVPLFSMPLGLRVLYRL